MSRLRNTLTQPRFALIAALAIVTFFVAEWVVSATWRGQYGYRNDHIGPLGVPFCGANGDWPCSALYPAMNVALVISGLAVAALALSWIARRVIATMHGVLLAAAGTGLALSGVFTEQVNYPAYATTMSVFQVLGPIAVLLIGASRSTVLPRSAKQFATLAGLFGTIGHFAYVGGFTGLLGSGGTERLAVYSALVAVIVLGCSGRNRPGIPADDVVVLTELEAAQT